MKAMKPRFRVLILDDEKHVHDRADEELGELGTDVEVVHASTIEEAIEKVRTEFFDLAFVDLWLKGARGLVFLRHLTTHAPSCGIVVVTAYVDRMGGEFVDLVGAGARVVGIKNKLDGDRWFLPYLMPALYDWQRQSLRVKGLHGPHGLASELLAKRGRINHDLDRQPRNKLTLHDSLESISDEVYSLLRQVFGPSSPGAQRHPRLELSRVIRSGYSSSVVVEAIPTLPVDGVPEGVPGNRCVIKVGPRGEISEEIARYERVVRFGVALEYRVELLGSALGDALGLVCYSFAGSQQTERLVSLQDMFVGNDSHGSWGWSEVLHEAFRGSASNWYSIRAKSSSLYKHFESEHHASLVACHNTFDSWVLDTVVTLGASYKDRRTAENRLDTTWRCKVGNRFDLILPLPQFLVSPGLNRSADGCLIHGDLHGGNILVDPSKQDPTFRFIDYRNAGLGPRLIDLTSLQASIRLAHVDRLMAGHATRKLDAEQALQIVHASHGSERALARVEDRRASRRISEEVWVEACQILHSALAENFKEATQSERLWTEFAYCLSMFRIGHLTWPTKVRLTVWLSALTERLLFLQDHEPQSRTPSPGGGQE